MIEKVQTIASFSLSVKSPKSMQFTFSFLSKKRKRYKLMHKSSADLEGSRSNERDVVVVQRERLEGGQGAKCPLRQELQSVLFQVDSRGLAGKLFGQLSQARAVT